ncbi:MAG: cytochrome d ubiquinol oxidase subunit II [Phycisphaerae bacterium]
MDLNTTWFVIVGVLFFGYALLDGFDLGVGMLHLFSRTDTERRTLLNAIGPVWDGNEVWLVTGGGALFAAFPNVYATLFSGFYLPFMMLLTALIFRAVSIEFRSKQAHGSWRTVWDVCFFIGSFLATVLLGVLVGNLAWGIPLNEQHEYIGGFWNLLHPYALLVSLTTVALFMMHGAIYLVMKTEGELHDKIRQWVMNTMIFFIICYAVTTMATLLFVPRMAQPFRDHPWLGMVAVLNMLAIANVPREIYHKRDFNAFLSSCCAILCLMALLAIGLFPNMIPSNPNPTNSLDIWMGASSPTTLGIMLIIALIGMPLVLGYTFSIYWIFRGKVKLEASSY